MSGCLYRKRARVAGCGAAIDRGGIGRRDVIVLIALATIVTGVASAWMYRGRESSRQDACRENMRRLATALYMYANKTTMNELPGYINALERDDGFAYHDPRTGRTEPVSWVVMVLPELDEKPPYQEWRSGDSPGEGGKIGSPAVERTHRYLELLVCPSDPPPDTSGTPLAYAVNTGIPDFPGSEGFDLPRHPVRTGCLCEGCGGKEGKEEPTPARDFLANGMFFDNFTSSKHFDPAKRTRQTVMTLAGVADRKDRTILLSENVDAFDYTFGTSAGEEEYATAEQRIGIVWSPATTFGPAPKRFGESRAAGPLRVSQRADMSAPLPVEYIPTAKSPRDTHRINVETGKGDGLSYDYARPSSKHPSGVNVAFVGSQVQFVKETLSYYVYIKLMTSNDVQIRIFDPQGDPLLAPTELRHFEIH